MSFKKNEIIIMTLVIAGITIFLLRNTELTKMWTFGDLSAFPTDIGITQNWAFSLWRSEGLGFRFIPPFNYYLTIYLASFILGSFITQKIIFLSTPIISFLTFYFLLRKINVNLAASALGALTYSINPITVSEFIGGSMGIIVYSTFPLIFFYTIKIIRHHKFNLKDATILGLLGFFIFNLHVAFWYFLVLIPLILLIVKFQEKNFKRIARLAIPLIIIVLILTPITLGYLQFYTSLTSRTIAFESAAAYCYKDETFYNLVRLAGNSGSAQAEEFLNYNTLNSYTILGYAIPIIAFLPFLTKNSYINRTKKLLITSASLTFIISSGIILVIKALPSIVDMNPIFASLRNPVKLMYPLSFSLCLLFAIGTEIILNLRNKHKMRWNALISITLATIILLYNYPALDGTLGLTKVRDESYYVEDKYYTLPMILAKIDESYKNYRFLILPWEYPMLLKIRSELPNYFGLSVGAGITQNTEWQKGVFEAIAVKNSRDRSYILGLFGVKYVIIDKNFRSYYEGQAWYERLKKDKNYVIYESQDAYWVTGKFEYFYQVFNSDPNFKLIYEDANFAIFKNNKALTKIRIRPDAQNLTLSYSPTSDNLLKNPSFENGTKYWKIWPSNLVNVTQDHCGNKTIILYGQEKWFTICYQEIFIEENALYKLKFSVKGCNITDMHAKILWYNITEGLKEGNAFSVDYIKLCNLGLKSGQWYEIEKTFTAPRGAVKARIYFLANRLKNFTNTEMYIDDVSFQEVEIILKNREEIFSSVKNINFQKINPTKYTLKVNVTEPFVLAFCESYDPLWVCYVNGQKIHSIPLYGVINGFYINQTGYLEITIEYEPQRWFNLGCTISLTTLLACTTYLTITHIKQKPNNTKKNKSFKQPYPKQTKINYFSSRTTSSSPNPTSNSTSPPFSPSLAPQKGQTLTSLVLPPLKSNIKIGLLKRLPHLLQAKSIEPRTTPPETLAFSTRLTTTRPPLK